MLTGLTSTQERKGFYVNNTHYYKHKDFYYKRKDSEEPTRILKHEFVNALETYRRKRNIRRYK